MVDHEEVCSAHQVHQPIPSTPIGIEAPTLPRMISMMACWVGDLQATDPGCCMVTCMMVCMVGLGAGVGCIHAWCWWRETM